MNETRCLAMQHSKRAFSPYSCTWKRNGICRKYANPKSSTYDDRKSAAFFSAFTWMPKSQELRMLIGSMSQNASQRVLISKEISNSTNTTLVEYFHPQKCYFWSQSVWCLRHTLSRCEDIKPLSQWVMLKLASIRIEPFYVDKVCLLFAQPLVLIQTNTVAWLYIFSYSFRICEWVQES